MKTFTAVLMFPDNVTDQISVAESPHECNVLSLGMQKATKTAELLCTSIIMGFSKRVFPWSRTGAYATYFINTNTSAQLPGM